MKKLRIALLALIAAVVLVLPARASGVSIATYDWSYDAGMVMVRGSMSNNSGISLPITLFVMEADRTLHEYKMTVSSANSTDFSFMFPRDKKPASLKLEWGARTN